MGNAASLVARLLLRSESRALRAAEAVLVDTEANAEHVSGLFNVPRERIRALPLALEVFRCKIPPPVPRPGHATNVFFFCTRSAERRVGKDFVSMFRSRCSP